MTNITKVAILPYSAEKMYNLVNNVQDYSQFLPWCSSVDIHSISDKEIDATLYVSKGNLSMSFRTRNTLYKNEKVEMNLLKGPFKNLKGKWIFTSLDEDICKITLSLSFEFSNRILSLTLGAIFTPIANTMLDAFCKRAKNIYGDIVI